MRNAVLCLVLAACGPSSEEVKTAKLAEYNASPIEILHIAADAAAAMNFKVRSASEERLEFITFERVYTHEGDLESAGADSYIQIRPGSVSVAMIVRAVVDDDKHVHITVTPKTFEWLRGSPQPRELQPDDPYLPPWVLGKADALQLAIYDRAKPYALAPPGSK